jgi:hypothetical protein
MVTHKRLVFGFHQSAFTSGTVRQSAETAGLLGIELHGFFLEDPLLKGAADFPGLREFRLADRQWSALNAGNLSGALDRAAKRARSLVEAEAHRRRIRSHFEVVNSEVGSAVEAALEPNDIVVIPPAENPLDIESRTYRDLLDAVCRSSATVLVLSKRTREPTGPVFAIAQGPEDRCIAVAEQIAARLHAPMLVEMGAGPEAGFSTVPGDRRRHARERMIIMSRPEGTAFTADRLLDLMAGRPAPILLLPANGRE